jgi:hypothetical protein
MRVVENESSFSINWINQSKLILKRIKKNLFQLLPVYGVAIIRTQAPGITWYWMLWDLYLKGTSADWGVAPPSSCTTAGCVYTNVDISHMVHYYGIPLERVFAVGNPDLIRFGFRQDLLGFNLTKRFSEHSGVIYIRSAIEEGGMVFSSHEEIAQELLDTRDRLSQQGFRLMIKLHPASYKSGLSDLLEKNGLDICSNAEFLQRLQASVAAIVEPSTAALIPALLGLPLFLARYGKLSDQKYGFVLTDYPRARYLDNIGQFSELFNQIQYDTDQSRFYRWVEDNIGPLPAEDMPARVSAVIDQIVQQVSKD